MDEVKAIDEALSKGREVLKELQTLKRELKKAMASCDKETKNMQTKIIILEMLRAKAIEKRGD